MNKAMFTGRMTKNATINYSNDMCIASWTLAVERRYKKEGQPTADFIRCKAFNKIAEMIEKFFHKGMKMDIVTHVVTGSYEDKNGNTVYTTDFVVDELEFGESKKASEQASTPKSKQYDDGFDTVEEPVDDGGFEVVDDDDDSLPFS